MSGAQEASVQARSWAVGDFSHPVSHSQKLNACASAVCACLSFHVQLLKVGGNQSRQKYRAETLW